MSKRLFTEMSADVPNAVLEYRSSDLQQLQQHIAEELARSDDFSSLTFNFSAHRRETPEDKAARLFNKLQKDEAAIEHGDWWKDSITAHALEELDVEAQWQLAIDYTSWCGQTIDEVFEWGGKLVNGSLGEWCPDTVREAIELWEDCLLAKGDYDCDCSQMKDLFKAFEQRHSGTVDGAAAAAEVAAVAPVVRIGGPVVLAPVAAAALQMPEYITVYRSARCLWRHAC
eukprot:21292-Heterococcus_DN1.PRE.1